MRAFTKRPLLLVLAVLILLDIASIQTVLSRAKEEPPPHGAAAAVRRPVGASPVTVTPHVMGGDRSSPTPTARPTPTPGPGDLASTDVDTPGSTAVIHVDGLSFAGRPFETIAMRGRYAGAQSGTVLRVQALEEGQWVDFPLPTITDDAGRFTAHIELGSIGEHRVRIVDQHNDAASETVIVVIR